MRDADDPITWDPRRITVAGTSGSGKSTLSRRLAGVMDCPYTEIDSLYHGPDWTPRESFAEDVDRFTAQPRWVMEFQYRAVRPLIAERADTLLWLDYPVPLVMARLVRRTATRRLRRQELWNGNYEPPFHTFFTDRDHIVRWGWRTRHTLRPVVPTLAERFAPLAVVRLRSPREAERWLARLAETLDVG